MNNVMQEQLTTLRIISKIQETESLTTDGKIEIYKPTYWNWFWRKVARDNKDKVVKFLSDFYKTLDQTVDQLIQEVKRNADNGNKQIDIAINVAKQIKSSFVGLNNLIKTYRYYPEAISALEGIVNDIAITTYKQLLNCLPNDKIPKELFEIITINGIIIYQNKEAIIVSPQIIPIDKPKSVEYLDLDQKKDSPNKQRKHGKKDNSKNDNSKNDNADMDVTDS